MRLFDGFIGRIMPYAGPYGGQTSTSKAVLVTGCSSDIGWATEQHLNPRGWTPCGRSSRRIATRRRSAYELARLGGSPDAVGRKIETAITAARPRARYTVTPSARIMIAQHAVLPDRAWDALMRTQLPSPPPR